MPRIPLQFVLIACLALIGTLAFGALDYVNQAKRAGVSPASFGAGAYFASITGRYGDMKAEQEAVKERRELQAMKSRELLPEPPPGWFRRDWTEADEARLDPQYDMAKDDFIPDDMKNDPTLKALGAMDKSVRQRRDRAEIYVYESGDEIVALRLRRVSGAEPRGMSGMAMQIVSANMRAMSASDGFAMVGGVAYRDEHGMAWDERDEGDPRVVSGVIGKEIRITARGFASDASFMALLSAIDYDQLSSAMNEPVAGVGNDAPSLDPETSRLLAEAAIRKDDAAMIAAAGRAMERLQNGGQPMSMGDALGLVLESYAGDWTEDEREAMAEQIEEAAGEGASATDVADSSEGGSKGGFLSKLGGFLKGGGGEQTAEVKQPAPSITFSCANDKGFKRCSAD